ncbi:MAG: hypothetical protein H6822_32635 [Planctomycetaceae bacterium]|nr:hypothetical protein [Planctomycetales bacterium]MCB9926934.1 hypothetical protein [Planctomycetaceae bacterium]
MLKDFILLHFKKVSHLLVAFLVTATFLSSVGCQPEDQIERYQVARAELPHRMLGAVVPQGDREWFFKVTGANEIVSRYSDDFTEFVKTISFGDDDKSDPQWQLPSGWTQEPGEGMRFATISIPTDEQPLELTVIPLPVQPNAGLLENINRWRSQLGLSALDAESLPKETTSIELPTGAATLVNLVGKSGASAPMASAGPSRDATDADAARIAAHAAAGVEETSAQGNPPLPPSSIKYEAPPEWELGQRVVSRSAFAVPREAAFIVKENDHSAEITITALGAGAGAVLPNVNRWRGQIGLDSFTEEQLAKDSQKIDMSGVEGDYVRLIGPQQAILGVIATHGGKAWFVKLQGDHDLAIKLQEQFETFVRSIKF